MIDNESLSDTIDSLQAEYFYKIEHQKIFTAIVNLFNHTQPVDILTVTEELKRMNELDFIGGLSYISELTNNVSSASNTEFHARIIAEKFIKRSLINISNNIIGDAFGPAQLTPPSPPPPPWRPPRARRRGGGGGGRASRARRRRRRRRTRGAWRGAS